jgi:ribonuclease P protein component
MNRPFSYNKEYRLKKRADIDAVYKNGKMFNSSFFTAYYVSSKIPRLGISIPSRFGNAVFRNREKRIAREVFRVMKNEFETLNDIMIILKKKPPDISSQKSDLERIFKCLGRKNPSSEK